MTPLLALLLLACPGGTAEREGKDGDSGGEPGCPAGDREYCGNGIDDDCDGEVDELDNSYAGDVPFYADADGDGYASTEATGTTCAADPPAQGSDCDDADPAVNPGAAEACDGIDNNCDGEGLPDCEWEGEVDVGVATDLLVTAMSGQWLGTGVAGATDDATGVPILAVMLANPSGVALFAPTKEQDVYQTTAAYADFSVSLVHDDPWYPQYPEVGCAVLSDLDSDNHADLAVGFGGLGEWNGVEHQLFFVPGPLEGSHDLLGIGEASAMVGEPDGGGLGQACAGSATLLGSGPSIVARSEGEGAYIFGGAIAGSGTAIELAASEVHIDARGLSLAVALAVADLDGDGTDDLVVPFGIVALFS